MPILPLALTLLETGLAALLLHLPIAAAMRTRGHAAWRVRDTLLTVPLLGVALPVLLATLNLTLAGALAPTAAAAIALPALAACAFGARAVLKLF